MTGHRLSGVRLSDGQALSPYWEVAPVILDRAVDADGLTPATETLIEILTETTLPCRFITGAEGGQFTLQQGPFETWNPPKGPWTVLFSALEHLFPAYDQLRKTLSWLPSWRFEDCMLSWASEGGSVGRHFDHFSVFLVQLRGRRHWQVGPLATQNTPLQADQALALVDPLTPDFEATLEPGDVLYLPPRVIHHGVALDPDCMTLSIGFRAPDIGQLLESALEHLDHTEAWTRFTDPKRTMTGQSAALTDEDLDRVRTTLLDFCADSDRLATILGTRVTEPYLAQEDHDPLSETDVTQLIKETAHWVLDPATRLAHYNARLFLNGQALTGRAPEALLTLADTGTIDTQTLNQLPAPWQQVCRSLIASEGLLPDDCDD